MVLKPIARRASLAAVGALLLVPGLTACDQPEAAAVVGSQIISQDELADMTEQLSGLMAVVSQRPALDSAAVLRLAVAETVAADFIADGGDQELIASVPHWTADDVNSFAEDAFANGAVDQAGVDFLKAIPLPYWDLASVASVTALQRAIAEGQVAYDDYALTLDRVKVNPRYGDLAFNGQIVPEITNGYPWLIPAASLAAPGGGEIVPEIAQ